MVERLQVEGWLVAEAEMAGRRRTSLSFQPADRAWLFRSPGAWKLLTMRRWERYDDSDRPASASATMSLESFSSLEEVGVHVRRTYYASDWVALLDAGHDHDEDLYNTWVPERIQRDFDRASIHNRDLAKAAGYFDPRVLPAPGKALPDWRRHALEAMASHLEELGYEAVACDVMAGADDSSGNEVVGGLRVRRHGHEVGAVVRVDGCGRSTCAWRRGRGKGSALRAVLGD